MKSIKLLAVLAIPAMFAACTNEEILTDSTPQLSQVVGAEVIGTDITINVSNGVGSRLNGETWQSTDKLGLAWIVNDEYSTPQSIDNAPDGNKWYANHMFAVEDGKFVTKGNAYKGWHFAYFPFMYTESVKEQTFNINPPQTSKEWKGGRQNDALHISPLKFLTRENLDENYQLKDDVVFGIQRAVNGIQVTTTADNEFAEGGLLADLGVKSITLAVQEKLNVFGDKVRMNVSKLPLDTAATAITKDSLYTQLYKKDGALVAQRSNIITTDVSKAGFVVGGTNKLITLTVPEYGILDSTKISIQVAVEGGVFNIAYVDKAKAGSNAAKNNEAIIALQKAYAAGGTMTKVAGLLSLNVVLYADIFETDFGHISNLEEWESAVAMATKLGRTEQEFGVDSIIDFDGEIAMPEGCAVTVKSTGQKVALNIKKSIESWPAGLTSDVPVINHKTISNATGINGSLITNYGHMKAIADTIECEVVNEGTITLKALAKLSDVDNSKGRINVAYGSYVTLCEDATDNGVIAYTVAANEKAYKINYLIETGDNNKANVNTLVVKSGRTLNLNLTDAAGVGMNDPYKPTTGAAAVELSSLVSINIELNEGTLEAKANSGKKVNNVEIVGGESNTISNVEVQGDVTVATGTNVINKSAIKGDLTIKDGTNTITDSAIEGDVTVESGTTTLTGAIKIGGALTVKAGASVVLDSAEYIYIDEIVNNGTLTANNDIFVTNVTLNAKSTTTLTDKDVAEMEWNKTIFYTENYVNSMMTLNGTVKKYQLVQASSDAQTNGNALVEAINAAEEGAIIYAPAGEYKATQLNLTNVAAIIGEEGTVINAEGNQRAMKVFLGEKNKTVTLKNIEIKGNTTRGQLWLCLYTKIGTADVLYKNVDVVMENVSCDNALIDNGTVNEGVVNAYLTNCKIKEFRADAWDVHPTTNAKTYTNVTIDATSSVVVKEGYGNAPANVTITKK